MFAIRERAEGYVKVTGRQCHPKYRVEATCLILLLLINK